MRVAEGDELDGQLAVSAVVSAIEGAVVSAMSAVVSAVVGAVGGVVSAAVSAVVSAVVSAMSAVVGAVNGLRVATIQCCVRSLERSEGKHKLPFPCRPVGCRPIGEVVGQACVSSDASGRAPVLTVAAATATAAIAAGRVCRRPLQSTRGQWGPGQGGGGQ